MYSRTFFPAEIHKSACKLTCGNSLSRSNFRMWKYTKKCVFPHVGKFTIFGVFPHAEVRAMYRPKLCRKITKKIMIKRAIYPLWSRWSNCPFARKNHRLSTHACSHWACACAVRDRIWLLIVVSVLVACLFTGSALVNESLPQFQSQYDTGEGEMPAQEPQEESTRWAFLIRCQMSVVYDKSGS